MNKYNLYLDFDNTIVDTISAIVEMYNEDFSQHKDFKKVNSCDVKSWEFKECNLATHKVINDYFCTQRFFDKLKFYEGSKPILRALSHIYNITIVSHGYPQNLSLKENWVKENIFPSLCKNCDCEFVGVNWEEYPDKSHIDMTNGIFVDDSIANLKTSNAKYKILYGECFEWNESNIDFIRCKNWTELLSQIDLLEQFMN